MQICIILKKARPRVALAPEVSYYLLGLCSRTFTHICMSRIFMFPFTSIPSEQFNIMVEAQ
jgi:hypothetical protein